MNKLKISTRLVMLIALLSALLGAVGIVGLYGISQANSAIEAMYEDRLVPSAQLDVIVRTLQRNRLAIAAMVISPTPELIASKSEEINGNVALITKTWESYTAGRLDPETKELAAKFAADRKRFVQEGLLAATAAMRANDVAEAKRISVDKIQPLFEQVSQDIDALVKLNLDKSRDLNNAAIARYETILAVAVASIVLGIAFAVIFGFFLVRGIKRSLDYAIDASNTIAQGDLTQAIEVHGNDEIAQLLKAMAAMKGNLENVVSEVRVGVDSVGTASAQIASGNLDLSARSEAQASSLEQTAASMEQLTATVRQSADSAKQADQLASAASNAATEGGVVMGLVVTTMDDIAASSKKMAEIINVIDGIAFQTNILALNAAVEAARAGDQGRGFAVVASEVRSLAQRSAQAAREIKTMIQASVDKVSSGSKLVADAGASMSEIVNQVKRVTDLIGEITTAAAEQSSGLGQVNEAVTQMDQMTQANAALVEEASAASSSLKDQAEHLAKTVSVFKISGAQTRQVIVRAGNSARKAIPGQTRSALAASSRSSAPIKAAAATSDSDRDGWNEF